MAPYALPSKIWVSAPGVDKANAHTKWARLSGLPDRRISTRDRKSTRLNSSHLGSSYAVFCLKKKIVAGTSAPAAREKPVDHVESGVGPLAGENCPSDGIRSAAVAVGGYAHDPVARAVLHGKP